MMGMAVEYILYVNEALSDVGIKSIIFMTDLSLIYFHNAARNSVDSAETFTTAYPPKCAFTSRSSRRPYSSTAF